MIQYYMDMISFYNKKNNLAYFFIPFVSLLVLDQVVKYWARENIVPHQSLGIPWPGVFEITLTYNKGVAFGLFQGSGVLFAPIAILLAGASFYYVFKKPSEEKIHMVMISLLSSGAVGNLIDRVVFEKVTDMFWLRIINFPVFNIADICISVSAFLMILISLLENKQEKTP